MKQIKKSDRPITNGELFVAKLDGRKTKTISKLVKKLSRKLHFPDYFGGNLDALADCLYDLSWIEQCNVKLFIKNPKDFLSDEDKETREIVKDIFEEATHNPIEEDRTFEVIGIV